MTYRFAFNSALLVSALAIVTLSGCGGGGSAGVAPEFNVKPTFIGDVRVTSFDGNSDDLLTAGLGKSGLQGAAPTLSNPTAPSVAELRRLAIYNNYRALVDVTTNGGYGVLFGPNIDTNGNDTLGEGKVAGREYVAYIDDGSGSQNVTVLIQIPGNFDRNAACIVTGTSSGSRGIYGAIGTSGEWGLKRRCAVAYTDKGTGMGVHDLQNNTVHLIDGRRDTAANAGRSSHFTANLTAPELAAFNQATPNRFAVKHAHSQHNPEKDWGRYTLQAVEFAFYAINEEFAPIEQGARVRTYRPENTLVIASSVSNGGGAALAAAEQDTQGLIDGVAVAEPQIQLVANSALRIQRGSTTLTGSGQPLLIFTTLANLYQPCAALATSVAGSPGAALLNTAVATNRCTSLRAKGLLTATTTAAQAEESLSILLSNGWQPESNLLHASHYALATPPIALTYANTYGRFSVKDNVCGFSFSATGADFRPTPLAAAALAATFATGNGIPPMSGINIVNNSSVGGPLLDAASVSPSTGLADLNYDGAFCLRCLATGECASIQVFPNGPQRVAQGISEVRRTGNLRGKPAIIVHGRSDALVPVNHSSRPYFGMNRLAEGAASRLAYIEVTNAQHFDAFIGNALLAGYDTRFVPLHRYFNQALDMVYAHLRSGAPLPPSQVVRTTTRGGTPGQAPAITAANVPPISLNPASSNLITFANNTVTIPD